LFETIGYKNSEIRFLKDHVARMNRAAKVFGFQMPNELTDLTLLSQKIKDVIITNNLQDGALIKLVVWRRDGGKYIPTNDQVDYIIRVEPKSWNSSIKIHKDVGFYDEYENSFSPISTIKTIAATQYIFAGMFKTRNKLDEVILLGQGKSISECLYSNIFWFQDGLLYTPSNLTGCVEGIMKKQILKACIKNQILFQEVVLGENDLLEADFIFTSNISGFSIIEKIKEKTFNTANNEFNCLIKDLI